MSDESYSTDRQALAARQAELLSHVLAGGPAPVGVPSAVSSRARTSLVHKRQRGVAARLRQTFASLGTGAGAVFAEFARAHPPYSDRIDDVDAFCRFLAKSGRLPPAARAEWRRDRLRRTRWFSFWTALTNS